MLRNGFIEGNATIFAIFHIKCIFIWKRSSKKFKFRLKTKFCLLGMHFHHVWWLPSSEPTEFLSIIHLRWKKCNELKSRCFRRWMITDSKLTEKSCMFINISLIQNIKIDIFFYEKYKFNISQWCKHNFSKR